MMTEHDMTRDWDPAIAGIVWGVDGCQHILYDINELIEFQVDRGIEPSLARENIRKIFAAAHDSPSAPLLFERATPAEAWAALPQGGDNGHPNRAGAPHEAPSVSDPK